MSETKLKPCPFCGGEAKIATHDWGYSVKDYLVYCSCGCELKKFMSKEDAINDWNTRKPMDNIVAELEKEREKSIYDSDSVIDVKSAYSKAIDIVKKGRGGMKSSELIAQCKNKPMRMPMCRECMGKSKKDCQPNPLNCVDFCICNHEKLKELGFDAFGK